MIRHRSNPRRRRREGDAIQVPGLQGYWTATNGLFTTSTGSVGSVADDPVGGWVPMYGTQKLIQATDAARPTLKAGVTPNGRNALLFDGTDDILAVANNLGLATIPILTVVVAFKPSQISDTKYRRLWSFYTSTTKFRTLRVDTTPLFDYAYKQDDATTGDVTYATLPSVNWFVLALRDNAGVVDKWANGVKGAQATYTASATTIGNFGLGSGGSGSAPFIGHIAAIAVYNRALSDTEVAAVSREFASRFGVTG